MIAGSVFISVGACLRSVYYDSLVAMLYTYRIDYVAEEDMRPYILRGCGFTRGAAEGIQGHILRGGVVHLTYATAHVRNYR